MKMLSIGRKQHLFLGVALSPLQRAFLLRLLKIFFFPLKRYHFLSWEIKSYCQFLPNPLSCFNEELHFFQQNVTK